MTAIDKQVGGDHYKKLIYQPFNHSMDINASPGYTLMVRYLMREKENREQDLKKCQHIVELEQEWSLTFPKQHEAVYTTDLPEEEKRLIKLFSSQFGANSDKYYNILFYMHSHQYEGVLKELEGLG